MPNLAQMCQTYNLENLSAPLKNRLEFYQTEFTEYKTFYNNCHGLSTIPYAIGLGLKGLEVAFKGRTISALVALSGVCALTCSVALTTFHLIFTIGTLGMNLAFFGAIDLGKCAQASFLSAYVTMIALECILFSPENLFK